MTITETAATGAAKAPQIFVYDDIHPEDGAMLQALYSRSPASVVDHLDRVKAAGSGKFMSQYYVGYGHASIGDCGVTTIFIENYSMMAAKAIQDNPLYSGQEASTRYLDFAQQPLHDPYGSPESRAILDGWMNLYNSYMPKLKAKLGELHPFDVTQYKSEKIWQNAVNARAFDIMRGFLPVGCTTLFSWTTNLRQARDKLMQLNCHPLPEIRQLAKDLFETLHAKYPNSFTGQELSGEGRYGDREAYYTAQAGQDNFLDPSWLINSGELSEEELDELDDGALIADSSQIDLESMLECEGSALKDRPEGALLNRRLASYGCYKLTFLLDFGSYRDLQRHRNGVCQVPLIEGSFGLHPWYMGQLHDLLSEADFTAFVDEALRLMDAVEALPEEIGTDEYRNQYLYPMGTAILCQLVYSVPQMAYVAELRSQKTVHPSLRPIAIAIGEVLERDLPGIALYMDKDADGWSAKRGEQTIEAKVA